MEVSPVKEMLKDLCHERWGWSYAVFWKPKCDNPTLFVWEDGYCRHGFGDMPRTAFFHDGTDLEILVFRFMFHQVHALGDGIVGRAASLGAYDWVLQSVQTGNNKSMLMNVELQLQFSAGIQTSVVIPLLPHGVLQLGSNRMIMENVGFVNKLEGLFLHQIAAPSLLPITNTLLGQSQLNRQNHSAVKRIFNSTSDVLGMSPLDFYNNCQRTPKPEVPSLLRHAYGSTQSTVPIQSPGIDSSKLAGHHSGPSLQQTVSFFTNNNPSTFIGTEAYISELIDPNPLVPVDVRVTAENNNAIAKSRNYCNSSSLNVAEWKSVHGPPSPSSAVDIKCSVIPNRFNSSNNLPCLRDKDNDLFQALGITPSATTAPENSTSYFTRKREFEPQMHTPATGDFFDALHVKRRSGEFFDNSTTDPSIGHYSKAGNSSGAISTFVNELIQRSDQFNDISIADTIMSTSEFEGLLDAVTWKTNSDSKQNSNGEVICCPEPISGTVSCSGHAETAPNNQMPQILMTEEDELHVAPRVLTGSKFTQTGSCLENVHYANGASKTPRVEGMTPVKSDVEDDKSANQASISTENSVKAKEMGKLRRNKSRPGEGSRPRPKDRQMIQDRLKDLRELIPDGEKYSIDALLERTIKHMLFLQSVTKHAEKMKQSQEWKGRNGGLALKDELEVGATWAFEVGSQSMLCPIIVEDLSAPHQMLVEILCGEHGSFLEIADTLRRMGLCILKGVMESRNGSMWARFVVEAQKDVSRMEVFMSLMQFVEAANLNASGYGGDFSENTLRKASVS